MQPSQSPPGPIDPSLTLYPPYYPNYQQPPPPHLPHHLVPQQYSSPSSQGSDTLGTPPTEHSYPVSSNMNGKRPAQSSLVDPRKKARKDDESEANSPAADRDEPKAKPTRGSRACTVCRRLKMKCVGAEQGPPCKRCISGNHECIFEESNRGKRSSKKHELLTRSLRKMEKTLDTVLRSIGNPSIASGMISRSPSPSAQNTSTQALLDGSPSPPRATTPFSHQPPASPKLHSLPDNSLNPLGLLAEASLANRRAQVSNNSTIAPKIASAQDGQTLGVASDNYFKPGPMTILPLRRLYIERQIQPEMLSFVSTDEVVELFNLYFDHINMHCSLLDRNFHTPSLVCSRSPFLLTTICSIASKFYTPNPDLHPRLTELAKKLAFNVPAKGYKSVEIVQAYLLLSLWGCGAVERYEQDKTWLLLGMAIRMATDLNLHRKTAVTSPDTAEGKARDIEVHNRERTWILCFCLDRSFSAQMGKPHSIKEDYIIRNAIQWHRSSVAVPSDGSLCAYAELQRILSRSLDFLYSGTDSASGIQTHCDYMLVIKSFESQLFAWREMWWTARTWEGQPTNIAEYKKLISTFYFNYAMLVLNSFGLQNALERAPMDVGHFFARVHSSAMACALIVRDQLGPSGYMKYSPDSHCVQTSYAVLSLLKLVRPEFQAFLENEQKTLALVRDVADVLEKVAASATHTPALYAAFLRALISAKLEPQQQQQGMSNSSETKQEATMVSSMVDNSQQHDASGSHNSSPDNMNASGPTINQGTVNSVGPSSGAASVQSNSSGYYQDPNNFFMNEFHFEGEMGPVADISTFPPTMAPPQSTDGGGVMGGLTMENILSSGFWDSMLVPGYNSMDGLSGGFVFGAGGSGLITPRFGLSPIQSGTNTPSRGQGMQGFSQSSINAAFDHHGQLKDGIKIDS
ncbi:hypothetical protein P691DRAFT_779516 [Macrolepiota fuliginosa MF-IS2]|uniref:Zn(2)-C6 fungal-type domain-containing protein n=1 Tax=Macrolepiota fuliginosa MF-IS2 TaxID=1400762 RepID=A0A9P5WZW3_9AGAR|nr:hypothetical protein P691DRAFT_779516 [Macrolepiota fuliginosa MF-IS2]